jgi:aryl-alcohol dehydrogenase-like predicted oxidoreductase
VQCEWSLWTAADPDLLSAARRHGAGIVAWAPLGGGFLAGGLTELDPSDLRARFPRLAGSNLALNNDRYESLRGIAGEFGLSPSQLALAWLLHQDPAVVPIPGSRTPAHITSNVEAASIVLRADTLGRIDAGRAAFRPIGASTIDVTASTAS